jgi:hypothetical protein
MSKQNLPEQLQKQSAAVQALYEDMELGEGGKLPGEDPIVEDPNKGKESKAGAKKDDASPSAAKDDAGKSKKKEEDWEQKYKTLQGMHNTEMPKLRNENQDLMNKVNNLEKLIAGMGTDEPVVVDEVKVGSVVTKEDIDNYGDSIDMMRRVSREEMAPVMSQLKAISSSLNKMTTEVMPKVDSVVSNQARTATQQFWDVVETSVPNWAEINRNEDFSTWLFMPDPMSGSIRQDLLEDAQKKGDAQRVVNFFNSWIAETGYVTANSETNSTARADANAELNNQIAPGAGHGAELRQEGEKPSFTGEEIRAFYNDVAMGKFKGREAERDKIEADIFLAQNENRVV